MYLFLNTVSSASYICLFDENREVLFEKYFHILGSESSKLMSITKDFLKSTSYGYEDIQNIVTVVWPGSFTGIRTTVLYVNTLAYIFPQLFLTPLSFFDLYKNFPIAKASSKRDLFVQKEKSAIIEILPVWDFFQYLEVENISHIYWDIEGIVSQKEGICTWDISYQYLLRNVSFQRSKTLSPLYIKKPNIT